MSRSNATTANVFAPTGNWPRAVASTGPTAPMPPGLGDSITCALASIGVTKARVEHLLGRPCQCRERQERLNALGWWAARVLAGKTEQAREYLANLLGEEDDAAVA